MKVRLITSLAGFLILISSLASAQVEDGSVQAEQAQNEPVQSEPAQNDPVQSQPSQSQSAQNSDTGVARISLIHGDVSTQRGDSGDWGNATLNSPVVSGDRVSTGAGARTEVQLDYANILRLDQNTEANVTGLSRTQIQIQLARGLANYSVLKDSEADVEIDAPNLSVHPRRGDASFRITVYSDDQAEVLVRRGDVDISTPQGSTYVRSGQSIMVRGSGNDTQYKVADASSRDDFDRGNRYRDNTIRNAQSWHRTNRYYVGSEDLDSHGRWTNVPDYGDVWTPAVASHWAPYRDGRWVWEPYWGWTWVSSEPWGWAPYHYGRWFMYENSWAWWPGQSYGYRSYYRPVWAPAYVSFFGFDSGFSAGFSFGGGFGSVGWLPIGPCDGYYPWWSGYRSRFNCVNITNVYNVNNYYAHNGGIPPLRSGTRYSNLRLAAAHDRRRLAVSTVNANDLGRGRVSVRPASRETLRNGRMVAGNLPVVPGRESLLAGQRRATPPAVARGGQNQQFFSNNHNRPVQAPRSFDREVADLHTAIQRDGRFKPIVGNQGSTAGQGNPRTFAQDRNGQNPGGMKPAPGLPSNGSQQGSNQTWRRPGSPVQGSNVPRTGTGLSNPSQRVQTGSNSGDWRRSPNSGAPQRPVGNGSSNSPSGRVNAPAPVDRRAPDSAPQGNSGQDWRRLDLPSSPTTRGSFGNGSSNSPSGRMNAPVDRHAPSSIQQGSGNQGWRRRDPPSPAPRSSGGLTEAPASRDRSQLGGSIPTQDRGNDWRRMPGQRPMDAPQNRPQNSGSMDRFPSRSSAPAQRDSGNWRQSAPRDNGRQSRPQLDMRQPIVTPRNSPPPSSNPRGSFNGGGGYSGGYGGARPAPSGGAYGGRRPAPSGGSYGNYGGGRAPSGGGYGGGSYGGGHAPSGGGGYGGGHSAPSGGGGHSAPSHGGGGQPSGGHHGR